MSDLCQWDVETVFKNTPMGDSSWMSVTGSITHLELFGSSFNYDSWSILSNTKRCYSSSELFHRTMKRINRSEKQEYKHIYAMQCCPYDCVACAFWHCKKLSANYLHQWSKSPANCAVRSNFASTQVKKSILSIDTSLMVKTRDENICLFVRLQVRFVEQFWLYWSKILLQCAFFFKLKCKERGRIGRSM